MQKLKRVEIASDKGVKTHLREQKEVNVLISCFCSVFPKLSLLYGVERALRIFAWCRIICTKSSLRDRHCWRD